MSIPAFGWAFEKGPELNLTSSQLMLLLYMTDQANGEGWFYTGTARMAKFTRLCERTVRTLIPQLAGLGLIRVEQRPGKPTIYYVLRQPEVLATTATPAMAATATPATTAVAKKPHPGNGQHRPRQSAALTPAMAATNPLSTQEEDPKTRAQAPAQEAKVLSFPVGRKSPAPPPVVSRAPPPDREPTPVEIEASRQRQLAEIAAMPPQLADAVRHLANAFEHRYHGPGWWPELTRDAQVDAVAPRAIKPQHLAGAALAAARAAARVGVPA